MPVSSTSMRRRSLDPAADDPDVAGYRVAQGVLDQVPEHAPEQRPVAAHPVRAGFDPPAQTLGRCYRSVAGGDLVQYLGDREVGDLRRHHAGIQLRHVKQTVQQRLQSTQPILQVLQGLLASAALDIALEHSGEQDQRLKGLPQVVAGRGKELGFCGAGPLGLLLGSGARLLCRLALGDVAGDADDPDDGAVGITATASWW